MSHKSTRWASMNHAEKKREILLLQAKGLGDQAIADRLQTTRNAIIGFRHRYNIKPVSSLGSGEKDFARAKALKPRPTKSYPKKKKKGGNEQTRKSAPAKAPEQTCKQPRSESERRDPPPIRNNGIYTHAELQTLIARRKGEPLPPQNGNSFRGEGCQWPEGEMPDIVRCDRRRYGGYPYCKTHALIAYNPPRKIYS